jgi:hypothetical protein
MRDQDALTGKLSSIENVVSGQKMIIYSIPLILFAHLFLGTRIAGEADFGMLLDSFGAFLILVSYVIAFLGLLRVASGLGYSPLNMLILIVVAFIPLFNLLNLLAVNARATRALKSAGYKVGLFGART